MLWQIVKEIIKYPVMWFWKRYRDCKKRNEVGKMILLFLFSLTGVAAVMTLLLFAIAFLIDLSMAHPFATALILGILWIYIKCKDKDVQEETKQQELMQKNQTELEKQAQQGYASMLMVMFQTLRAEAENVGGVTPTFMGEIELPGERYRLSNGICFYTFMLKKQDMQSIYSKELLQQYKENLQFEIHSKLNSGAFPTIHIVDYQDAHGGMDGIVIHSLEDYGKYLIVYAVYASETYADYKFQLQLQQTQRAIGNKELTASWEERRP